MNANDVIDGLLALGFTAGFAISGEPAEIIVWENEAKQPTNAAIAKAAPKGAYMREVATVESNRKTAYANESDPLFFQWQAGEGTEEAWKAKRAEIEARYPYPTEQGA